MDNKLTKENPALKLLQLEGSGEAELRSHVCQTERLFPRCLSLQMSIAQRLIVDPLPPPCSTPPPPPLLTALNESMKHIAVVCQQESVKLFMKC